MHAPHCAGTLLQSTGGIIGIGGAAAAAPSSAQPMREPSYAWMIIARPVTSSAVPPVLTTTRPIVTPLAFDVYAIVVHGSDVTVPVK